MKNPKVIIIAAVAGFFFSLITALVSGVRFGAALLKAFVSAAVCAAAVAGLSFTVRKFLLGDTQAARTDEARGGGEAGGSIVNIVLEDEELSAEPGDPLFSVSDVSKSLGKPLAGQGHPKQAAITPEAEDRITAIDAASPRNARTEPAANEDAGAQSNSASFTPAHITSIAASASIADAAEDLPHKAPTPQTLAYSAEPAAKNAPAKNGSPGAGLIDLPDIGMLVTEGLSTGDEVIVDTEFASATKDEVAAGHRMRAAEDIDISDSKAIAGAIRTLLVK